MARLLCVVKETFEFQGRGLVFVPGIVPQAGEIFRIGDTLRFKLPNGKIVDHLIGGLEIALRSPPPRIEERDVCVMLKGLTKADLPIGTEVYSTDESR